MHKQRIHRAEPPKPAPTPIDFDLDGIDSVERSTIEIESITLTGEQVAVGTEIVADITVTGPRRAVSQRGIP